MLKHCNFPYGLKYLLAAAFGRLCVETVDFKNADDFVEAAAFGRLCVETK